MSADSSTKLFIALPTVMNSIGKILFADSLISILCMCCDGMAHCSLTCPIAHVLYCQCRDSALASVTMTDLAVCTIPL